MDKNRDRELARLDGRPLEEPPSGLLAWEIEPFGDATEYAERLRSILRSGVAIAAQADFSAEEIESNELPRWFDSITDGYLDDQIISEASQLGQRRYYEVSEENQWNVQDWLFCFDPELRHWEWWDLTTHNGKVVLWVDSKAEPVFACEELRWAVYSAGANSITNLGVLSSAVWRSQISIGL